MKISDARSDLEQYVAKRASGDADAVFASFKMESIETLLEATAPKSIEGGRELTRVVIMTRELLCEIIYRRRADWDPDHPNKALGLRAPNLVQMVDLACNEARWDRFESLSKDDLKAYAADVYDLYRERLQAQFLTEAEEAGDPGTGMLTAGPPIPLESESLTSQPLRMEGGVVQFGDDWPGIFMRGDEAFPMGLTLEQHLTGLREGKAPEPFDLFTLAGLASTLKSCEQGSDAPITKLRSHDDCRAASRAPQPQYLYQCMRPGCEHGAACTAEGPWVRVQVDPTEGRHLG